MFWIAIGASFLSVVVLLLLIGIAAWVVALHRIDPQTVEMPTRLWRCWWCERQQSGVLPADGLCNKCRAGYRAMTKVAS